MLIADVRPGQTIRLTGSGGRGVLHEIQEVIPHPDADGHPLVALRLTNGSRTWTTAPMYADRPIYGHLVTDPTARTSHTG